MSSGKNKNLSSRNPGQPDPGTITSVETEFHFSGPLPPPQILARYNEVIPNGAERILAMAEQQSRHRESLEAAVVKGNLAAQKRGSIFAFVLASITIVGGIVLIYSGKGVSGLVTIITSLVALVSVFFYSKSKQGQERTKKATTLSDRRRR